MHMPFVRLSLLVGRDNAIGRWPVPRTRLRTVLTGDEKPARVPAVFICASAIFVSV